MSTPIPDAQPWLSVLIPVYNVEPYLEACVTSVLGQGVPGVEVLLYDDASTDGSAALMQRLAASHPGHLGLLHGERNQGLSAARNALLEASQGRWIWFLDSDDFLLPGAIARLQPLTQLDGVDLVLCDFEDYREAPKLRHRLRGRTVLRTHEIEPYRPCADRDALIEGMFVQSQLHAWSKIGRRELYGSDLRFPPGRYFEDIYVTPSLVLRASSVVYAREPWVAYRKRPGSILTTPNPRKWEDLQAGFDALPALLAALRPAPSEAALAAAAYFVYRSWMRASAEAVEAGDWATVNRFLDQCERNAPRTLPAVLAYCRRRGWLWRSLRLATCVREARKHRPAA